MIGWHYQHNGHGFGWTPGVGDGQGGLVCCGSWGLKELDMDLPDTLPTLNSQHQTRNQRVMTHAQAAAEGINEQYMREVTYRPAWTIDTVTKSFENWVSVRA